MYFDAQQTYEALAATERYRPPSVQSGMGKSNLIIGVITGILIGRKWPVR